MSQMSDFERWHKVQHRRNPKRWPKTPDDIKTSQEFWNAVVQVGAKRGYKTLLCPYCVGRVWSKSDIVEPNLEDEILKGLSKQHLKRNTDLPPDCFVSYLNRVEELGGQRGFEMSKCPHCSRPLWTHGKIVEARL